MEYLSNRQLEKYEDILKQIEECERECSDLKTRIQSENDKILTANIALHEHEIRNKIFQVNVKVFDTVFEIYDALDETLCRNLQNLPLKNCKYYAVEVYISKLFQEKLSKQTWVLHVCVTNSKRTVSQSLLLKKRFDNPCVIVPFDGSTEDATVHTTLCLPSTNLWTSINLETVTVDVSYHFKTASERNKLTGQDQNRRVLSVLKNHRNPGYLNTLLAATRETYNFVCKCTNANFVNSFLKNCYHRLDVEVFADLTENNEVVAVETSASECKCVVEFDRLKRVVSVKAGVNELCRIKKYFIRELRNEEIVVNKSFYSQLVNVLFYVRSETHEVVPNVEDVKIVYEELRKLWFQLPI